MQQKLLTQELRKRGYTKIKTDAYKHPKRSFTIFVAGTKEKGQLRYGISPEVSVTITIDELAGGL
jgi:hypothetical protein